MDILEVEKISEILANRVDEKVKENNDKRILIAIAGPPGSGKTTISKYVAKILNQRHKEIIEKEFNGGLYAVYVPMDGFHYTRAQLGAFPDPEEAFARRGSPFTFDAEGVVGLSKALAKGEGSIIKAPSFDHVGKDPVTDGICINKNAKVILYEGNYLLLNEEPWRDVSKYATDKWLIKIDKETMRERLAKRHVASGIVKDLKSGYERADSNDVPNGIYLLEHSVDPDVIIYNGKSSSVEVISK